MDHQRIFHYFPHLSEEQQRQIAALGELYAIWNAQINVISRKDFEHFYERHVLHSLAIAKVTQFRPETKILDVGTGGGFPGIPLAILFPEVSFTLLDSIGKKIKVVNEVSTALGLKNVQAFHQRAEERKEKFDFVVSRAVTALPKFVSYVQNSFRQEINNALPNGILYLKGGDFSGELKETHKDCSLYPVSDYFTEEFFETKHVVYIQMV
jgi:16S rRNA (guanine527-N7)-methyltransferase